MLLFAGGDRPGRPGGRQGGDRASLGSRGALPAVRSEAITGGSIPRLISISSWSISIRAR